MKNAIIVLILLASFSGCGNTDSSAPDIVRNDISKVSELNYQYEDVSFAREFIHASDFFVASDSVLIVINKPSAGHFVEFYNISTKQCLGTLIAVGNGPKEMLNAFAEFDGRDLLIRDFVKGQYISINVMEFLEDGSSYVLDDLQSYRADRGCYVMNFRVFDENQLLILNPYGFRTDMLEKDAVEARLFYDKRPHFAKTPTNANNVNQGFIRINNKEGLILYASDSQPLMEIYDLNLKLKKRVIGPTDLPAEYVVKNGSYAFKENIPYAYMDAAIRDNDILMVYRGNYLRGDGLSDNTSYLLCYDWNGILLSFRRIEGQMKSISLTSDERIIYCSGYDKSGKFLYRIIMD